MMKYYPYGDRLESEANLPTDRLFTGQRYDDTGLYYYGARYYDPEIGRFISPDTIVPDPNNPQSLNRYSYCVNNPLKYTDPNGYVLYDSQGNNIEDIDRIIYGAGVLAAYGYMVNINVGSIITDEYMFINDMRIIEQEQANNTNPFLEESTGSKEKTISDYIQDDEEWVVMPRDSGGMDITKYYEVGPGGYWDLSVTCILGVGFKGGAIYDDNGWHLTIGGGIGLEVGGGISTSGDPLVSGVNSEFDLSWWMISKNWGYSAYSDEYSNSWGPVSLNFLKYSWGGSLTTSYIFD